MSIEQLTEENAKLRNILGRLVRSIDERTDIGWGEVEDFWLISPKDKYFIRDIMDEANALIKENNNKI